MSDDEQRKVIAVAANTVPTAQPASTPTSVPLGPSASIDLSWLPEAERKALLTDYVAGVLDVSKRAQDLHVDVGALKSTLQILTNTAKEASEDGNAATITHTQTSAIGRTEIIIGNTETAHRGKLSRSQTGEVSWTPYYIIAAIVAVVIIVALLAK